MVRKKNSDQGPKMTRSEEAAVNSVRAANDEKATTFLDAINKYAKEQSNKINDESQALREKELKKAENEILNDAYKLIQSELNQARKEITSSISKEQIAGKKELFRLRTDITIKVFDKVKTKLIEFTKTPEYPKLLENYAKVTATVLTEDDTVIYLRHDDMCYEAAIKKVFPKNSNCIVKEADNIEIGGLRGANQTMGLVVDETLDSKLANQYEWFQRNSELRID